MRPPQPDGMAVSLERVGLVVYGLRLGWHRVGFFLKDGGWVDLGVEVIAGLVYHELCKGIIHGEDGRGVVYAFHLHLNFFGGHGTCRFILEV